MSKKIKVLIHSNYSRMKTGFGKNMRNVLLSLHEDPEIEICEAANGVPFGADPKTPWPCFGTAPSTQEIVNFINNDPHKSRIASYGFYEIDKIVEEFKPDVYLGIEDIWAFDGFAQHKSWWNNIHKIIWTTLDSSPILPSAYEMSENCDKLLVWASFSEREMLKNKCINVETLHGTIDLTNFKPLNNKKELKEIHGLSDNFIIGFVFKNQLRKSVPNLLEGFRLLKEKSPELKPKLLLHTDWADFTHGWNIPMLINEKGISPSDILATYSCENCGSYSIKPYSEPQVNCDKCHSLNSSKTKNNVFGVSEIQLNEIYNLMDVYCHPFTSGGQEMPIQEAKAAGLVALVTSYSCGEDSCYEHQGGIPLNWNEYREPNTHFIKASTCPQDICDKIYNFSNLSDEEKKELISNGINNINEKFSCKEVVANLKKHILNVTKKPIKKCEQPDIQKPQEKISLDSLLDKEKQNRILVVLPKQKEDVFLMTTILKDMKKTYPEKDIYFATEKENHEILLGNPYIYKVLTFHPIMENLLLMEGNSNEDGYFEICFIPHIGTQKILDYCHNGKDRISLK